MGITLVGMSSGSDPAQIRAMLATAQGYAVFDREGTRIGAFIEVTGAGNDRIAIRHEGVFVWRRRLLPVTSVATVIPDKRAVVLTVDGHALAEPGTPSILAPETSAIVEEHPRSSDWRVRLESYVGSGESRADQDDPNWGAEHEPSPDADEEPPAMAREVDHPTPEPGRSDQRTAERHLLFVSTPGGYVLVEREGPPPSVGRGVELPEQAVSFLVTKVGPSPLPNDSRICAYLEPTDQHRGNSADFQHGGTV
jgi:hypothetical protein